MHTHTHKYKIKLKTIKSVVVYSAECFVNRRRLFMRNFKCISICLHAIFECMKIRMQSFETNLNFRNFSNFDLCIKERLII